MRLPKEDEYSYNRYMDSLSVKASEIFTLQNDAEFKIKENIVQNAISEGLSDDLIAKVTGLTIENIVELRKKT